MAHGNRRRVKLNSTRLIDIQNQKRNIKICLSCVSHGDIQIQNTLTNTSYARDVIRKGYPIRRVNNIQASSKCTIKPKNNHNLIARCW